MLPYFGHVRRAYLIGEAAEQFEHLLDGKVESVVSRTLDQAFHAATDDARNEGRANPTVLLAPACASFDQFPNFEARGDAFKALVESLRSASSPAAAAGGGG